MRSVLKASMLSLALSLSLACGDDSSTPATTGAAGAAGGAGGSDAGAAGAGAAGAGAAGAGQAGSGGGEAGSAGVAGQAGSGGSGQSGAGGAGGEAGGAGGATSALCEFSQALDGGAVACAVRPSATDAQISDLFGHHALGLPATISADTPVYVHLVGSGGDPAKPATKSFPNEVLLRELTAKGVLVLMVAYDNLPTVGMLCKADLNCYEPVRREIIFGQPAPAPYDQLKDVSKPQDIVSRLEALVAFFKQSPEGKVALPAALAGSKPDTTKMRVGGHSQGGGHAGLLAKDFVFERVCMFSSPIDADEDSTETKNVPWVEGSWATPLESRRAVIHEKDKGFDKAKANLDVMGMVEGKQWKRLKGPTQDPHPYTVKGESAEAVQARNLCVLAP